MSTDVDVLEVSPVLSAVWDYLSVSRPWVERAIRDPLSDFPRPIKLSQQRRVWLRAEVDAWLALRAAQRPA